MVLSRWRGSAVQLTRGLPAAYWYLCLGTLLNRLGWFVLPFLTIYLTRVQRIPIGQAAFAVALYGLGTFASKLAGGILADRIGRRRTILLALGLTAGATLILGLIQGAWLIAIVALLFGFFNNLSGPAVNAMIADMIDRKERVRAYGLQYWAGNVGQALAPIIAGVLSSRSYLALFVGDALTTVGYAILVWWRVPETHPQASGQHSSKVTFSEALKALRGEPLFLIVTLLVFGFMCIWFQSYVGLPLDMRAHGLTNTQYGSALALNAVVVVALSVPMSHLLGRFPRCYVLAGANLLLGIGFGLTALVSSLPLYALTVVIWSLGEIAGVSVGGALVADLSPPHRRGLFQGVFATGWGLSTFVGPALGGLIIERMGTEWLWLSCFLLGCVLAISYFALARPMQRRLAQQDSST